MALTKQQRDALPAEHFAVPGKRALPINDERHTKLAWDMVERTKDLTPAERKTARERILKRAKDLGIDTKDWSKLSAALSISAMSVSLEFPANDDDHPNKMPFSGILTRLDQPSDAAPEGSGGRLVCLTSAAAEEALPSLLGMAIDFTPNFDGHDAQRKVGIITDATIEGDAIHIAGFVYAADFPAVAKSMKAHKEILGFSFEMTNVYVADPASDPLVIVGCVFTGAAVLRKDKAAYTSTSLAANAADLEGLFDMDPEELKKIVAGAMGTALAPITTRLDALEQGTKKMGEDIAASKEMQKKVKPLAETLHAAAAAMCAAGVGTHSSRGHAKMIENVADDMEAQAALGQTPHAYPLNGYYAARDGDNRATNGNAAPSLADDPAFKKLTDELAASKTQIADLTKKLEAGAKGGANGGEPARKTLTPQITALLSKVGATPAEDGSVPKLSAAQMDKALETVSDPLQRMVIKRQLERAAEGLPN
ncbi:MAG: hypothetical protein GC190_21860 [Alphaproteobacteria bacterium]|nr:hypothetical protein [Alphaproteobacteria bacterium]